MSTPTSYALVSLATGHVQTFVRPDLPPSWTPPEGYTLVARESLPEGWQMELANLTLAQAESLLDSILDGWAQAKGYVDAARCITYATDPDATFSAEGQAMLFARSAVWVAARALISAPTFDGILTEAGVRSFAAPFAPYWIAP
jgi:hypothetical protein